MVIRNGVTFELLLGHVIELNAADDGSLLDVGVDIMQTLLDGLLKILSDALEP